MNDTAPGAIDPFTFAVIHRSLIGIARDMKLMTMRTAYTQLWKEQGDLSCCLMDGAGDIVAQDPNGFPIHVTTMPMQLKGAVAAIGRDTLEPGDIIATNDPYIGGTHLPDVLIARPLFHEGELFAFACNRGHWADIGGMGPGSYSPSASDIHQEGLFIPPVKLVARGVVQQGVIDMIIGNIRNKRVGHGDLRAQYASTETAATRFAALVARYGFATVRRAMGEIVDRAEAMTRAKIAAFKDGVYHVRDCLDGDGINRGKRWVDVKVTVSGSDIEVDLTGSDPTSAGGMNCSHSAAASAVQYAIKAITDPENPPNAGSYRPVKVLTKPGTLVDAQPPASMIGFGDVTYRVMDATLAALAPAVGERAVAAGSGSTGTVVITGPGAEGGAFISIELASGAWGARYGSDGISGMRYGPGNAGHIPIEADEMENPLLFERYEIVPDTGGAGRTRGGNGFVRAFRVECDGARICLCSDRDETPPPGLDGGAPGTTARFVIDPDGPNPTVLPSKTAYIPVPRGSLVHLQSAGGAGMGSPGERDGAAIADDVADGYVTPEHAAKVYGWLPTRA
ncbi:hydantoinase B/oxoprolinase family protein [Acuticoccus sediminis]|uniref:hydantoinase B/oxoprolinase family protein n=1 Tax=Acuticoccus sediminis TaxID=2184697 RepID=UPI001CFEC990|nr:hydantoinase B/oxoprolinase family protein [Acuticoccus sediminis]